MTAVRLALIFLSLTAGNFIYQSLAGGDWVQAGQNSYFQGSTLISVWLAEKWELFK